MASPFAGEIRITAGNLLPKGWAYCNGQLLPINQFQLMFALLGTFYGGDGQTTFALPDLRGRFPIHASDPADVGTSGGAERVVLTAANLPDHSHTLMASADTGNTMSPAGKALAVTARRTLYAPVADTTLAAQAIGVGGGSQAHDNRPPYLTLNYMIALEGEFPSRF